MSSSRTYASLSAPSSRIAQRSPAFQFQRRWATNEAENEAPVSAVEPTEAEELESASSDALPAADSANATEAVADETFGETAPPVAETANATEATEESFPAAETGEKLAADSASSKPNVPHAAMFDKKATLYVGNLFFDVTETDIVKEFARFGTVSKCKIVRDSRGLSKGYICRSPA